MRTPGPGRERDPRSSPLRPGTGAPPLARRPPSVSLEIRSGLLGRNPRVGAGWRGVAEAVTWAFGVDGGGDHGVPPVRPRATDGARRGATWSGEDPPRELSWVATAAGNPRWDVVRPRPRHARAGMDAPGVPGQMPPDAPGGVRVGEEVVGRGLPGLHTRSRRWSRRRRWAARGPPDAHLGGSRLVGGPSRPWPIPTAEGAGMRGWAWPWGTIGGDGASVCAPAGHGCRPQVVDRSGRHRTGPGRVWVEDDGPGAALQWAPRQFGEDRHRLWLPPTLVTHSWRTHQHPRRRIPARRPSTVSRETWPTTPCGRGPSAEFHVEPPVGARPRSGGGPSASRPMRAAPTWEVPRDGFHVKLSLGA